MKICPLCQAQTQDHFLFCQKDGTRLVALVDPSQLPTVPVQPPQFTAPPTQPVARAVPLTEAIPNQNTAPRQAPTQANFPPPTQPATIPVNQSPTAYAANDLYTTKVAGVPVVPPAPAQSAGAEPFVAPPAVTAAQQAASYVAPATSIATGPAQPKAGLPGWLKGSLLALLFFALAGLAFAYFAFLADSPERRYETALKQGKLVTPIGASAFDLYQQLKRNGTPVDKLFQLAKPALPQLLAKPQQMLADVAQPGKRDQPVEAWEEAARALQFAQELTPKDTKLAAQISYIAGRVAFLNKKRDEAITHWKRAAEQDKTWFLPLNGLGLLYNETQKADLARYALTEAIKRDPNNALPYNNLGTAHLLLKEDALAEQQYRKAIELAPDWPRPHAWLAEIGMRRKDYELAIKEFEIVLGLDATTETTLDSKIIRKKLDEARKALEKLPPALPPDPGLAPPPTIP